MNLQPPQVWFLGPHGTAEAAVQLSQGRKRNIVLRLTVAKRETQNKPTMDGIIIKEREEFKNTI